MTANEFSARIDAYLRSLQLPAILSDLGAKLARSADAEAAGIGQVALAAATGAQTDTARLADILRAALTYISQIETGATAATRYSGTFSQAFTAGAAAETHDVGVSATWVTALTTEGNIMAQCISDPAGGGLGDVGLIQARCKVGSIVAGVGFTVRTFKPAAAGVIPAASYNFSWWGYA